MRRVAERRKIGVSDAEKNVDEINRQREQYVRNTFKRSWKAHENYHLCVNTDWLGIAPEGKFPARKGTKDDGAKFTTAWNTLPAGVDTKKPLGEIYPPEVLDALRTSPDTFKRWGITQNQGKLVGATLAELPVPKAVNALTNGQVDAAAAAKQAADAVRNIQKSLN